MPSVIAQLQADALDRQVPLTDLVRRAYVIARKLGLYDFERWLIEELNGYTRSQKELPDYRMVSGEVKAWNPFHGWQPVIFQAPAEAKIASKCGVGQSIAELEDLLKGGRDGQLHIPLPQDAQRKLGANIGFETNFSLFVARQSIVRILDAVRNNVLEWALRLEEDGISGEGLTFSEKEKEAAAHSVQNVNNFFGSVGEASIVQPGNDAIAGSVILNFDAVRVVLKEIRANVDELELVPEIRGELESELATLEAQLASPKPKRNIVAESLASVRAILEGAGGGVAGHLVMQFGKLLLGA